MFKPFGVDEASISTIANLLFEEGLRVKNYESVCYSLYYAIKYDFPIDSLDFTVAKQSNHCLFLLFSFLCFQKAKDKASIKLYKDYARELSKNEMDTYWLFIYETLPQSDLHEYWKPMKRNKVSFIKEHW